MGWAQMHLKQTQSQTAVALPPSRLLDCCDVNGGNERKQFSLHQRLLLPVNLFYFAPNDPPSPGKRIASRRLRSWLRGKGGENFILIAEFMLPFVATATSSKCPPILFLLLSLNGRCLVLPPVFGSVVFYRSLVFFNGMEHFRDFPFFLVTDSVLLFSPRKHGPGGKQGCLNDNYTFVAFCFCEVGRL